MSGARVAVLSHADIEEITEARRAIEVFAARTLVASNDKTKTELIQRRLRDLISSAKSGTWVDIVGADVGFHGSIVEATANGRLLRFWEELEGQLFLFLSSHAEEAYQISEFARKHESLVDAILSGDIDTVTRAFESHIRSHVDLREQFWSEEVTSGAVSSNIRKATQRRRVQSELSSKR
jgi:DNA-binding GntR family transcriptional regulator